MKFRYFTFILLLVICKILSFLATWIPFSFSTELYDIQSCSRVSPTASNPVKFFILFRAKFKITKFFSPFKFAILSIAFVHRFNFLQFTSTNNLKIFVSRCRKSQFKGHQGSTEGPSSSQAVPRWGLTSTTHTKWAGGRPNGTVLASLPGARFHAVGVTRGP